MQKYSYRKPGISVALVVSPMRSGRWGDWLFLTPKKGTSLEDLPTTVIDAPLEPLCAAEGYVQTY